MTQEVLFIMRMRKKKNLIPRMDRCADRLIRDPYDRRGSWRELMPEARELRLELGCGKGRFTAGVAALEPDVLFIAVEMVPDAMVVAMERCVKEGLTNVFFVDANADQLPSFFAPDEVDRIYLNFSDPWPGNRHAKRRLTHGNFLKLYRKVLKMGGQIHFKTDNQPLFEFSVEEIPQFGFTLSEVTRDLHANGPVGVMTDYEAKFYEQGMNINRLVATMEPWEEPFPTKPKVVYERWLDSFAEGANEAELGKHVLAENNYLWHLFSYKLVPCLEGEEAKASLPEGPCWQFYCEYPPEGSPLVRSVTAEDIAALPADLDWYLVDKDFTWTYVHTHEADCGPYFCKTEKGILRKGVLMDDNIHILRAESSDIPELYALQLLAFESEADMIQSRDIPALMESKEAHQSDFINWITLKAVDPSGKINGAIRYRQSGDVIEIGRLMVHPDCRRKGFAQRLMAEVEKACPYSTKELYTCTKSWINIRLYEKIGYKPTKEVTENSGLSFVYMQKF